MHTTFQNFSLTREILTFSGKPHSATYILTNPPPSKEDDFTEEDQHCDNECITCIDHFLFVEEFNVEGDSDFFQKSRQLKRLDQDKLFRGYSDTIEYEDSDDEEAAEPTYQMPYNMMSGFDVVSKMGMTKTLSGNFNIRNAMDIYGGIYAILSPKKYREKSYALKFPRVGDLTTEAISFTDTLEMLKMVNNRGSYGSIPLPSEIESVGLFDNLSRELQFAYKKLPNNFLDYKNAQFSIMPRFAADHVSPPHLMVSCDIIDAVKSTSYAVMSFANISKKTAGYPTILSVKKNSFQTNCDGDFAPVDLLKKGNRNTKRHVFQNLAQTNFAPNFASVDLLKKGNRNTKRHVFQNHISNNELNLDKSTLFIKNNGTPRFPNRAFDFTNSNCLEKINNNSSDLAQVGLLNNAILKYNNYKSFLQKTESGKDFYEEIGNQQNLKNFRNSMKRRSYVSSMLTGFDVSNHVENYTGLSHPFSKILSSQLNLLCRMFHDNNQMKSTINPVINKKPPIDSNDPNITITRDSNVLYNSSNADVKVFKFKDINLDESKKYEKGQHLAVDSYISQYLENYNRTRQSVETIKKKDQFKSVSHMNIFELHNILETNAPSILPPDIKSENIPLKVYTCWHTKSLPPKMEENYYSLVRNNPELEFSLFDETECRNFIKRYFDKSVLNAYDSLIPSSYKSDLWRYCVLHKNGGIYIDIKYNCVNGFKLMELCKKEHFVLERKNIEWERNAVGLYTALIVTKPYNDIMSKCIKQIVENVSTRYCGFNALYPTGPGLLGSIYFKNKTKDDVLQDVDAFFSENQMQINYNNKPALEIYLDYRKEQLAYQNAMHYSLIWETSNIYKLSIEHELKRDFSATIDSDKKSLLVICHIGNFDVFEKMRHYISFVQSVRNNYNVDVVFNLVKGITSDNLMRLNVYFPEANIIVSENYGFDIGSFYHILNIIKDKNIEYDYVLKIHTKTDDVKRFNVLDSIMSSRDKIIEILKTLDRDPEIGCVSSIRSFQTDDFTEFTRNKNHLNTLLDEFGLSGKDSNIPFPAGSMFWIRFDIIKRVYMQKDLLKICQTLNTEYTFDYNWFYFAYYANVNNIKNPSALCNYYLKNRENLARNLFDAIRINSPVQKLRDGMIEHAHERMIAYAVNFCGNKIMLA